MGRRRGVVGRRGDSVKAASGAAWGQRGDCVEAAWGAAGRGVGTAWRQRGTARRLHRDCLGAVWGCVGRRGAAWGCVGAECSCVGVGWGLPVSTVALRRRWGCVKAE